VVRCGAELRCAKVYKEAEKRSFRQSVLYREGRKQRNSRSARAMENRSRFGREEQEEAWQSAEASALYRLAAAGVRAPKPYGFSSGVLLMELILDEDGDAAPRLNDLDLSAEQARELHRVLIGQIVRMLCAGIVHGDLSEFNVLVGHDGPVLIDFPQAVDAAGNNNARKMLERDVANVTDYFGQFAPELLSTKFAQEMWKLYELGELHPEVELTGRFEQRDTAADVDDVLREIEAAREENDALQRRQPPGTRKRTAVA
jgi:RIO kinase 1